ncbi:hypothetical protein SLA2020_317470 [Shorea laevis]
MALNHHHLESTAQHNSALLLDALYCSEENWEEGLREDFIEEEEGRYCGGDEGNVFPILLQQDMLWEDEEISCLLKKEEENKLYKCLGSDASLAGARQEAVDWMMKREMPWMTQLTAVACLSLAAKVEETQVPLLLDLQVEDSRYIFEAKTIQRMEILVLSTLKWKMNPVTPLSFLDYIARRLGLKDRLCWEFLRRCDRILLSVISDLRFMRYIPSVMATATMLHVLDCVEPNLRLEYQNQVLGIHRIDKDKVDDCFNLITESAIYHSTQSNKRKFGSIPSSPNGVMEVSFSSDSSNDSWSVTSSVSSSPEPMSKKIRVEQDQLLQRQSNAPPDPLSIPR